MNTAQVLLYDVTLATAIEIIGDRIRYKYSVM